MERAVPAALIGVLVGWALVIVAWEPAAFGLLFDDSFYYFALGRNLAEGHGSSFDQIHETNGYHPAWMLFCAALYALGLPDEVAPVVFLVVQLPMVGLAFGLLAAAFRRIAGSAPGADLVAVGLSAGVLAIQPLAKLWINGLESAFVGMGDAALILVSVLGADVLAKERGRERLALGALIAWTFVSRTDGALMLVGATLWALPRWFRDPKGLTGPLLAWLGPPSLVVLAYMATNQALFESAVQVSGRLKQAPFEPWRVVVAILAFGAPWALGALLGRAQAFPRLREAWSRTAWFGTTCGLWVGWYSALQVFPRLWYFGPVVLYGAFLGACAAMDLLEQAAREKPEQPPLRAAAPLLAMGAGLWALAAGVGAFVAWSGGPATPLLVNREMARWVRDEVGPEVVLGSWDAGVVGYYARHRVVNLDGVVNSAGFLRAMQTGTTAEYLAPSRIQLLVNHAAQGDVGAAELKRHAAAALGNEAVSHWTVVGYLPFRVVGGLNQTLPTDNLMAVYAISLDPNLQLPPGPKGSPPEGAPRSNP